MRIIVIVVNIQDNLKSHLQLRSIHGSEENNIVLKGFFDYSNYMDDEVNSIHPIFCKG
jgi:hypothetical protein